MDAPLHPIVDECTRALAESGGGLTLPDRGRERLEAALSSSFGKPELLDAVRTLVAFAFFLKHERGADEAALALLQVADGATDALKALGQEASELARELEETSGDNARRFEKMMGAEKLSALVRGGEAPEGTGKASPLARFTLKVPGRE